MIQSENLAEKRVTEEKKAFARRLIVRGKQTLEEIAEDAELPIEVVKDLAVLQSVPRQSFRVQSKRSFQLSVPPFPDCAGWFRSCNYMHYMQ